MLEMLHIENIAIIERSEIAFTRGFNALTGETGAGKSIVIDSMSAVLGQRTSRDLIRTGADKAFVSAWFSHVPASICEDLGITPDEDGNLLLQREIHADGKNVCRVGSRPVTALADELEQAGYDVRRIGDCARVGLAGAAVEQGFMVGRSL